MRQKSRSSTAIFPCRSSPLQQRPSRQVIIEKFDVGDWCFMVYQHHAAQPPLFPPLQNMRKIRTR